MRARFGTAGNPEGFYAAGKKQSKQMPGWLRERGLDAYEYQCGKGVTVGEATARAIGQAAAQAGIALSLHAPYFVNPANPEPDSQAKTAGYVLAACRVARWMGADRVVVHTGAIQKRTRQAALATARECFRTLRRRCDEEGYQDILLCPETMGKIGQLGTLDEVLALCGVDSRITPCIDFGHLYARSCGVQFADATAAADYAALLDTLATRLGDDRAVHFHAHFSRIAYTKGGEKCHLTFADTAFGPPHAPLLALLKERHLAPTIICESAGTQAEDAAALVQGYAAL